MNYEYTAKTNFFTIGAVYFQGGNENNTYILILKIKSREILTLSGMVNLPVSYIVNVVLYCEIFTLDKIFIQNNFRY